MRICHFWAQNDPFVMNSFFLVQTIIITFIYLLALFIVQNLKRFLQQIQIYEDAPFLGPKWSSCPKQFFQQIKSYEDAQFLGQKWPISPNENFFRTPLNESCFFHSYLSTCQKSKSDINLLVKY